MGKLSNIIPVSDLRQDAANIMKRLRKNKEPLIITQRGRAAAVIIGVIEFNRLALPGAIPNAARQMVLDIGNKSRGFLAGNGGALSMKLPFYIRRHHCGIREVIQN